jgi:hypothetical protein
MDESRRSDLELSDAERTARAYVLGVILPLWIASGSADYILHRRSAIERTAGSYESRLHVLGIALTSLPVLAGLLLEINAGVIAGMSIGYLAHLGMTIWDVAYADEKRTIVPLEQHVHGMLELLPFCALSFVICTYREQALALAGRSRTRADFRLRRKRVPISRGTLAAIVGGFGAFVALPFCEELRRCVRYERAAQSAADASAAEASR